MDKRQQRQADTWIKGIKNKKYTPLNKIKCSGYQKLIWINFQLFVKHILVEWQKDHDQTYLCPSSIDINLIIIQCQKLLSFYSSSISFHGFKNPQVWDDWVTMTTLTVH